MAMQHAPAQGSISANMSAVRDKIIRAAQGRQDGGNVRLVAVSKLKPVAAIHEAYAAGQRVFGENYVQELVEKAPQLPADIQWHLIGPLQSNKAKMLLQVPNVAMVESVHSLKTAQALDKHAMGRPAPLPIMVQVNTSGEDSKSGIEPADVSKTVQDIIANCKNLRFVGLMTIGNPGASERDFSCLIDTRTSVCTALSLPLRSVELSMGMSGDYEKAVEMGATNVRVGSAIFGHR
jgi:pyridoxal phosphate enzyme (YggS family)